jgi:hypothetical protein
MTPKANAVAITKKTYPTGLKIWTGCFGHLSDSTASVGKIEKRFSEFVECFCLFTSKYAMPPIKQTATHCANSCTALTVGVTIQLPLGVKSMKEYPSLD